MKKYLITVLIVAFVILLFCGVGIFAYNNSATVKLRKQLDLGNKCLIELDYNAAVAAFELAIDINPKSVDAYLGLSDAYVAKGDYDAALQVLQTGLDAINDPQLSEALKAVQDKISMNQKEKEVAEKEKVEEKVQKEKADKEVADNDEPEEVVEYIKATDADLKKIEEQAAGLYAVSLNNFWDENKSDIDNWGFWTALLFYYADDVKGKNVLPISITGMKETNGFDPRGYSEWGSMEKSDEVKWIACNVFNVPEARTNLKFYGEPDEDGIIWEYLYEEGGNYYFITDGLGICAAEEAHAEIASEKDGLYNIDLKINNPTFGERVSIRLNAFLKEEKGKTYWSFLNIAESIEDRASAQETVSNDSQNTSIGSVVQEPGSAYGQFTGVVEYRHHDNDPNVGGGDYDYWYLNFNRTVEVNVLFSDEEDELLVYTGIEGIPLVGDNIPFDLYLGKKATIIGTVWDGPTNHSFMIGVQQIRP